MNEHEEKKYNEIREELLNNEIEKKVGNYYVNRNEISRYYNVGKIIIEAQGGDIYSNYGDKLIQMYSDRLTKEIGKGYTITSLKRMRKFYLIIEKGAPLVPQLSWSHYVMLLPLNSIDEIKYYINEIIEYHWSKRELQKHIKNKEYQRLPSETKDKLINSQKSNVYDLIKNPIIINTYGSDKTNISEKILKEYILHDIDNFLKELGNGFSYIANEYKIKIGNKYNYVDLLLFNFLYNAFVVVELKVGESNKNHLGQIMVYMNYIDKYVRKNNQDKTIGIIISRKDNKYLIEYSSDSRIKLTTYKLV